MAQTVVILDQNRVISSGPSSTSKNHTTVGRPYMDFAKKVKFCIYTLALVNQYNKPLCPQLEFDIYMAS